MFNRICFFLRAIGVFFCFIASAKAISLGQTDDFQDGTTKDWGHVISSPNPPINISDGGPHGIGDNYLEVTSTGGSGSGSRLAVVNGNQWIEDYLSNDVTSISASVNNLGTSSLYLRFAVRGGSSFTYYVSIDPIILPINSGWQDVSFDLSSSAVSPHEGTDSYLDVFSNVDQARIISSESFEHRGDSMVAQLGIDDITAVGLEELDGDFDFDGDVDGKDFLLWQRGNSSHGVDPGDLMLWQNNYGAPSVPESNIIPEPACTALLVVGIILLPRYGLRGIGQE